MNSLLDASTAFAFRAAGAVIALERGLNGVLVRIENTARAKIGHYQGPSGGFPAWAPLSPATEAGKSRKGKPLLDTGAMLASFSHETHGLEGVTGATDFKMIYHEAGTSKMPPRPVWGPAAHENRDEIERIVGMAAVAAIMGEGDRLRYREDGSEGFRYQIRMR